MAKSALPNIVRLEAESAEGALIERHELSVESYYDGDVEIIDSASYRAEKGIRHLRGEIYDALGESDQRFDIQYSSDGRLIHSRTEFADGTVNEHTF